MKRSRGIGSIFKRGSTYWIQFYVNGQRVRMSAETTEEAEAKRLLRDKVARVTLGEPLVVRAAKVSYDELRADLVAHYTATGERDLEEAGYRLAHFYRAFRGVRAAAISSTSCGGKPRAPPTRP
jgi:hypothetical protein